MKGVTRVRKLAKLMESKHFKTVVLAVLTVLYLSGIVCLFFNAALGVTLWAAAMLPSLVLFLYQKRKDSFMKPEDFDKDESKGGEKSE